MYKVFKRYERDPHTGEHNEFFILTKDGKEVTIKLRIRACYLNDPVSYLSFTNLKNWFWGKTMTKRFGTQEDAEKYAKGHTKAVPKDELISTIK